jgi:hypothetical protein
MKRHDYSRVPESFCFLPFRRRVPCVCSTPSSAGPQILRAGFSLSSERDVSGHPLGGVLCPAAIEKMTGCTEQDRDNRSVSLAIFVFPRVCFSLLRGSEFFQICCLLLLQSSTNAVHSLKKKKLILTQVYIAIMV